jgi:hypothetical protein
MSCEQATWSLGFDVATATLVRDFGFVRLPGASNYSLQLKDDLTGFFVLVVYQTHYGAPLFWLGFIERIESDAAAVSDDVLTGTQRYECFGLEKTLDTTWCDSTVWIDGTTLRRGEVETEFNRNGANKSPTVSANPITGLSSHVFTSKQDEAAYWTTRDIIQYILAWHYPRSSTGEAKIKIGLVDLANVYALDIRPEFSTRGRSVRDVLNSLLHGNNLLTWYLRYTAPEEILSGEWVIDVVIISLAPTAITLPSGATQPSAANTVRVEVEEDALTSTSVTASGLLSVDQVRVRGARRAFVFTAYMCDTTEVLPELSTKLLVSDWSESDQASYISAATTEPGYGDLSLDEKKQANGFDREKYPSVFADYRVNWRWNCISGNGEHVFGTEEYEAIKVVPQELRLLPEVPLYAGVDYSGALPVDETYQRRARFPFQPIRLWAWEVKSQRLFDARGLAAKNAQHDVDGDTPCPEITITPNENKISFVVRNAEQHTINNLLSQGLLENRQSLHVRKIAAAQSLITVGVTGDSWCEGVYPESPPTYRDVWRVHTLYAGSNYQHVTMVPGTILGLNHLGEPKLADGGVVRDDSLALRDLARIVYEWMSVSRSNLSVKSARIDGRWALGSLVAQTTEGLQSVEINSPIARIQIQSPRSLNGDAISPQMIISTALLMRDWQRVLDELT